MDGPVIVATREEYDLALARAWALLDAKLGTAEGDELDALALAITAYEALHGMPFGFPAMADGAYA